MVYSSLLQTVMSTFNWRGVCIRMTWLSTQGGRGVKCAPPQIAFWLYKTRQTAKSKIKLSFWLFTVCQKCPDKVFSVVIGKSKICHLNELASIVHCSFTNSFKMLLKDNIQQLCHLRKQRPLRMHDTLTLECFFLTKCVICFFDWEAFLSRILRIEFYCCLS